MKQQALTAPHATAQRIGVVVLVCICLFGALSAPALAAAAAGGSPDISIVGLFSGKAAVVVDNGRLQIVAAGSNAAATIRLLDANATRAVFDINGRRETLGLSTRITAADARPAQTQRVSQVMLARIRRAT